MNSKTIKKHGSNKKYLRQDKNYCLVCKKFVSIQPNSKNWKREIATQVTKCSEYQKKNNFFSKEIKPKKISKLQKHANLLQKL